MIVLLLQMSYDIVWFCLRMWLYRSSVQVAFYCLVSVKHNYLGLFSWPLEAGWTEVERSCTVLWGGGGWRGTGCVSGWCQCHSLVLLEVLLWWTCSQSLIHISMASYFWDIGKQYRPRWDAAERSVLSGSTLFAYRNFFKKWNKNEKILLIPLTLKVDSSKW